MHRYCSVNHVSFVGVFVKLGGVRSDSPKASKPGFLVLPSKRFLQFEFDGYHMIEAQTPNGIEYIIDLGFL